MHDMPFLNVHRIRSAAPVVPHSLTWLAAARHCVDPGCAGSTWCTRIAGVASTITCLPARGGRAREIAVADGRGRGCAWVYNKAAVACRIKRRARAWGQNPERMDAHRNRSTCELHMHIMMQK
jgi:hypothetical protein